MEFLIFLNSASLMDYNNPPREMSTHARLHATLQRVVAYIDDDLKARIFLNRYYGVSPNWTDFWSLWNDAMSSCKIPEAELEGCVLAICEDLKDMSYPVRDYLSNPGLKNPTPKLLKDFFPLIQSNILCPSIQL